MAVLPVSVTVCGTSEMASQEKVLAATHDDLSSISGTDIVERKNKLLKAGSCPPHMLWYGQVLHHSYK